METSLPILVACEESQTVTIEFRKLGYEAYSCDLQDCSGGHPEWHIKEDVRDVLYSRKWGGVIAHPTCTRLCNSGVRWLAERNLWHEMELACDFFNVFTAYGKAGNKIRIENPIPHKYAIAKIGKYSQIIHPWQFGHPETKATCLWNYNLPNLVPTNIVAGREGRIWKMAPGPERTKERSKTYPGIAAAIASQFHQSVTLF